MFSLRKGLQQAFRLPIRDGFEKEYIAAKMNNVEFKNGTTVLGIKELEELDEYLRKNLVLK